MGELIGAILIIYLLYLAVKWYIGIIGLYYQTLAGPLVMIIGVITAFLVFISFIRAYYECFSRKNSTYDPKPDTKEPAFLSYYFHQGYIDYAAIVKRAWQLSVIKISKWGWKLLLKQLKLGFFSWLFLPFMLPLYGALIVGVIISIVPFLLLSIIHTAVLGVFLVLVLLASLFLNIVEKISMLWRSLNYVCPHTGCYQRMTLPIFVCPSCGAWHKKLIPGKYGVFRRKCECGKLLPTSPLTGRSRLDMICPNSACNKPLHTSIGSAPSYHFAVLGEPSCGKTSYLYALIYAMLDIKKVKWFSINNDGSKRIYDVFRQDYTRGIPPLKTVQKLPDSLILKSSPEVGSGLFYFYDPAGEYFLSDSDTISQGSYQQYLDGLFFVIDPFSLPTIKAKCTREELEQAGAAAGNYVDVYERLVNYMRSTYNEKLLRKVPVSVIITKCDLIHSNSKFRSPVFNFTEDQLSSWLGQNGLEQIMSAFKTYFQPELVKFFAVSSFGSSPSVTSGKPFNPVNVIEPYSWLLTNNSLNPETGSVPVLKMKSEFVGNTLGFATASLLFFLTFSFASGPVINLSKALLEVNIPSLNWDTSLGTWFNSIKPNFVKKNVILNTNPDFSVFFEQSESHLNVLTPTQFHLEGSLAWNPESLEMSDRFIVVGQNDSLAFDSGYVPKKDPVKAVSYTYEIKADFSLPPGSYSAYFFPAVSRRTEDINRERSFRKKHLLWQLKFWSSGDPEGLFTEPQISELQEATSSAMQHWAVKNLVDKGYLLKHKFLRDKPGKRPILYLLLSNPEERVTKTVKLTLTNNLNAVKSFRISDGAAFDFGW